MKFGPYVTGVTASFATAPVAPGLIVNSSWLIVNLSVFVTREILVDLPVVFPVAMETKAVAAVYANT